MANEISASAGLTYLNTSANIPFDSLTFGPLKVSVQKANPGYAKGVVAFGTATGTVIPLGGVGQGTLGWAAIKNNDLVNNVIVFNSVGGVGMLQIQAQEFALFRFNSTITAPAIQAQTAGTSTASSVSVGYMILPD